jgi:hypothetical protein
MANVYVCRTLALPEQSIFLIEKPTHFSIFSEEIEFLLECTETNHEGNIEYAGFLSCFLDPAKEIR